MNDLFPPSTLTEVHSGIKASDTEVYKRRAFLNKQFSTYVKRLSNLFSVPRIRRATIAAAVVMISQQLCGINIIVFYSGTLLPQPKDLDNRAAVQAHNKTGLWLGLGVWLITLM
jgi:hypothetical protein